MRYAIACLVVSLFLIGCSNSNNNGVSGINGSDAGEMNGARNGFESAEDPPITANTHFAAGQMAEVQGDYARASKQYKEALKLDPNHKKSLYRQGVCLSGLKKYPEAIATWKKYIELTGGDAVALSNLGFCHELAGQIDEAESAYRRGIEKDQKNVPCRTNYGLMLARIGRTSEATIQLQAVLTPAEVHYNLASVLEAQGKKEQARKEYQKALEIDPFFTEAKDRLAALH